MSLFQLFLGVALLFSGGRLFAADPVFMEEMNLTSLPTSTVPSVAVLRCDESSQEILRNTASLAVLNFNPFAIDPMKNSPLKIDMERIFADFKAHELHIIKSIAEGLYRRYPTNMCASYFYGLFLIKHIDITYHIEGYADTESIEKLDKIIDNMLLTDSDLELPYILLLTKSRLSGDLQSAGQITYFAREKFKGRESFRLQLALHQAEYAKNDHKIHFNTLLKMFDSKSQLINKNLVALDIRLLLVSRFDEIKNFHDSKFQLKTLSVMEPEVTEVWEALALYFEKEGDLEESLKFLKKAYSLRKYDEANFLFWIAGTAFKKKDYGFASDRYKILFERFGHNFRTRDIMNVVPWMFTASRDDETSMMFLKLLQQSMQKYPTAASITSLLALELERLPTNCSKENCLNMPSGPFLRDACYSVLREMSSLYNLQKRDGIVPELSIIQTRRGLGVLTKCGEIVSKKEMERAVIQLMNGWDNSLIFLKVLWTEEMFSYVKETLEAFAHSGMKKSINSFFSAFDRDIEGVNTEFRRNFEIYLTVLSSDTLKTNELMATVKENEKKRLKEFLTSFGGSSEIVEGFMTKSLTNY